MVEEATLIATVAARAQGCDAAFAGLTAPLRPRLLAVCANIIGNAADAQDAVQDALVLAYRALPQFQQGARFSTWVFRIAIREALRRRRRAEPSLDTERVEPGADPAAQLEARDVLRRTQQAMAKLSADHRVVLALCTLQGLPHTEVALILGVPEGTVWRRLHEARKALLGHLALP